MVLILFITVPPARIQPSIENSFLTTNTNVNGTLSVLEASKRADVKRVIYSSTSSSYNYSMTCVNHESLY